MLRLSKHCHIFTKDANVCLFHATGISPVYFSERQLPLLKLLETACLPETEIIQRLALELNAATEVVKSLQEKNFLVASNFNDEEELGLLQQDYTGTPRISVMYLLLSDSCNLSCTYCYIRNLLPKGYNCATMSEEMAITAIQFFTKQINMAEENEPTIIFYGGEPLLNFHALKAATLESKKQITKGNLPEATQLQIVTNGTLLTNEIAKFLKQHRISVVISIDGPTAAHTHSRTNGTQYKHKQILNGLRILTRNKLKPGISCTLNEETLRDFDHLLNWLVNDAGTSGIGFNLIRPIPPFTISDDYAKRASEALILGHETLSRHGIPEDRMQRKVSSFVNGTVYPYDCAGCGNQIVVAPDGAIGPCAGFLGSRKYFVTNAKDDRFDPKNNAEYLYWSKRSPLNLPQCRNCPAIAICGGGCPFSAEINQGSLFDLDEIFCVHAKTALQYLIWKLQKNLR